MAIKDGARIKIARHANGKATIDVLAGIEVGKAMFWYDLNHIRMAPRSPDLRFDYSDDHTKKVVSMREIVE